MGFTIFQNYYHKTTIRMQSGGQQNDIALYSEPNGEAYVFNSYQQLRSYGIRGHLLIMRKNWCTTLQNAILNSFSMNIQISAQ
jgi:hypothetical protein